MRKHSGKGTIKYNNGYVYSNGYVYEYEGEFKDAEPHGVEGRWHIRDEGDWNNGKRHGNETCKWTDGSVWYVGEFQEALFSMEQELAITETFTKENGMPAKGGAKEK